MLHQLLGDWVHSFQSAAATVLSHNVSVAVYSGKRDYICNYLGGKSWTENTNWSGQVLYSIHIEESTGSTHGFGMCNSYIFEGRRAKRNFVNRFMFVHGEFTLGILLR